MTLLLMDMSLTTRLDEVSATATYIGRAAPGSSETAPVWQLKLLETTNTVLAVKYPNGVNNFNSVWADRALYQYS